MPASPDPGLFQSTAWHYARFRPGYPDDLIDLIAQHFGSQGSARLLDLGTGTGQLALPLAAHFAEVVAVDPEPAMLAEAAELGRVARSDNVRFVLGSSETLPELAATYGSFDAVTMGSSFHWMRQDETLRLLDRMVYPGGGVVAAGNGGSVWSGEEPWHQAVRTVIRRWLGEERRAGAGHYVEPPDRFEDVLARSPFSVIEEYHRPVRRDYTLDQLIGLLYSSSFASPAVLGEQRAAFADDLRDTLKPLLNDGVLSENVVVDAWLARRGEPA